MARPRIDTIGRSVPEWIGRTPDSVPPPHVIQRIAERFNWRCHISGAEIDQNRHKYGRDWQLEHVVSRETGGQNRESNLAPALTQWHKLKSKAEAKERGKRNRGIRRRTGITKPKHIIPGSKASGVKMHLDGSITCRRTGKLLRRPR